MSSRSNSSNQSKGTHLPLQKRVFNAPLAAVIAMGCVTGIAGGIAATSAHPMQAAYAASSTTQGVFTLDRAAEGMDRSAKPEIPKEKYPVRYMLECEEKTLFKDIVGDMGECDNIPMNSPYRTPLQNIYGLSGDATIAYNDSAGTLRFEKDGSEQIIPLSNLCYIWSGALTQPVPVQVSDSNSLSPEDKTKIINAFIKANPKQKTGFTFDITADQITFEQYPSRNNMVDILVWRGNPKTMTEDKDYVQSINHVFYCGLRHLYYNNTDAHKKRDFPWGTNDDDEQLVPDKVEITEQVSELSAAHKKLIKDNIQKCIQPANLDCSSLDFTVDEASNKVTITLDGYNNAEEPLDSLIIRKIVPIELKAPAKKVPLADTSFYKPTDHELDKAKDQLIETNGDAVQKVEYDASKFTVKITEKNGSIVTKELPELFYLVPTPKPDSPLVKTDVKNVDQLLPTEIGTIKQAIARTYKIQHQDCITIDTAKKCVTATWDSGNKGFSMSSPNNFDYYLELPFADVIKPAEKTFTITDPAITEVANTAQIQEDEVAKIKAAIKAANPSLNLEDSEITVDTATGKVTIKRQGFKDATLEAAKVVKQKAAELQTLNVADPAITEVANTAQIQEDEVAKIKAAIKAANPSLNLEDSEITVDTATGKVTIKRQGFKDATLEAAKVVKQKAAELQTLNVADPAITEVANTAQIQEDEVAKIKAAIKAANPSLNLEDSEITVDTATGKVTIKRQGFKDATLEAAKVVKQKAAELQTLNVADPAITEVANTAQIQEDEVAKIKAAIKAANPSLNLEDSEITVDTATGKVTIKRQGFKDATLEAAKVVKQKAAELQTLNVADPAITEVANTAQIQEDEVAKIKAAIKAANPSLNLEDSEITVDTATGKVTIKRQGFKDATLEAAKVVKQKAAELQTLNVADPAITEVANTAQIQEDEVAKIKAAIKAANPSLNLEDSEITVDTATGKVTIKRQGFKDATLEAAKVVKQKAAELQTLNVADPAITEVANTAQIQEDEVAKIKAAIKAANPSLNLEDSEITVDTATGKVTIKRQGFKDATLEAAKVVKQKELAPIEPPAPVPPAPAPAPEPPAKESPREILKRTNPAMFVEQSRYAGKTALDTMAKIVEQAFPSAENVVLATQYGYWDALSANALAGSLNAPIMLSDFDSLPEQTVAQLKRLQAKTMYICGGTHVISKQVEQQLHQLGMRVVRYAGSEASDTATKIALNTETVSDTCFITTSWGYGDSMSVSSYSYAKHAPIFLTNMNGDIDYSTLDAIRAKGFKRIVLVGGTSVISAEVEDLVRSLGVSVERVWGETQYDTSLAFAKWATQDSKEPLTIGISTGYGFTDALCGAALTGKAGGVMVLADDSMTKQAFSAFKDFVGTHAKQIEDLQIFGGTSVVGMGVTQALTSEFKEAYQNDNASAAPEGTSTPTQPQGTAGQTQPPLRREN